MRENRGPLYLFTGILIGLIAGLLFAWLIEPVQFTDALPSQLNPEAKDRYRAMIALAFQVDANLGRARQRLALLNDSSPAQALAAQAQGAGSANEREAQAIGLLADAYNPHPTAVLEGTPTLIPSAAALATRGPTGVLSPTATLDAGQAVRTATLRPSASATIAPTMTQTPAASLTPRPTLRISATLGAPFAFKDKQKVCDPSQPALLQVEAFNSANLPISGVQIRVSWPPANQDTFFTGLSPEIGLGYADFQMSPKTNYAVQVGDNGESVSGIAPVDCVDGDGSGTFQGGWKIKFVQP